MITKERFNNYLDVNEEISLFAKEYIKYYYQLNGWSDHVEIKDFNYSINVKDSTIEIDAFVFDEFGCGDDESFDFPFSYLFLYEDEWKKQLEVKTLEENERYRKIHEDYEKKKKQIQDTYDRKIYERLKEKFDGEQK